LDKKDDGLYLNKTFLAALLALCLAVIGSAAKAFVDVVELKTQVKSYVDNQNELKEELKEIKTDIKTLLRRE
jgi:cell division protein FtsB